MKHFAIICRDNPNSAQKRKDALEAHFAHVERVLDQIAVGGPLKNNAGEAEGSLLIVKADTAGEARALLESDPYFSAGIWADIQIIEFTAAAGEWIGGKIW